MSAPASSSSSSSSSSAQPSQFPGSAVVASQPRMVSTAPTRLVLTWCWCTFAGCSERMVGLEPIINMHGNSTTIADGGRGREHTFTYDHSFWSSNREDAHFADQEQIYRNMGTPLLKKAFEGYNCCLFAYGQTGSGKSYRCVVKGSAVVLCS